MSQTTLSLAQQAMQAPNGTDRALSLLEQQVERNEQVANDATIWACIAHLRRKKGDNDGAEKATQRARELVDGHGMEPRKLSFEEALDGEVETGVVAEGVVGLQRGGADADAVRVRCEELLCEMVESKADDGGTQKVERLVARSKRLREISEVLLRGME